jgi:PAS domain S-box-containing protein
MDLDIQSSEENQSESIYSNSIGSNYEIELKETARLIIEFCGAHTAIIILKKEPGQRIITSKDFRNENSNFQHREELLRIRESLIIPDVLNYTGSLTKIHEQYPTTRFCAVVPLTSAGKLLGVLTVLGAESRNLDSLQRKIVESLALKIANRIPASGLIDKNYLTNKETLDIIERISDAFLSVSHSGHVTYINRKALSITGKTQQDILGKELEMAFTKEFSDVIELSKEAMTMQQQQYSEVFTKDRWLAVHLYPSSTGLSIHLNDITAQKQTEIKLGESERRLHTIIQVEPECVKILGSESELLEMNPAGLAMIEADNLEQVRGLSVLPLVSPDYRESFAKLTRDVFKGNPGVMEFEMTGLKGTQRWIETHAVPLRNQKGNVTSLLGVSRDITDRKIAEKKYRDIFDNILTGIYQATVDGKFLTANPAMAKMFGYASPEELIKSVEDIRSEIGVNPEDRRRMKTMLEEHGQVNGMELKIVRKNDEAMWVRANIRAVKNRDNNIQYIEGALEDITQSRRAERKLKKQFKVLQKTNHELDRFVYSASHDLRAPLASILGILNIAELEPISDNQKSYLQMIRNSIGRLDGFINDILNYSRNARTDIKISAINFNEIIRALNTLNPLESGIDMDVRIESDHKFYSDRSRLEVIFNNLFSNAVKFRDPTKDRSWIRIEITTLPEQSVIKFSDNGIGIEEKYLDKVFDMFFRATERAKGSGLGLYIVKETVAKLRGTIEVKSAFGKSTTFEITLPNHYKKHTQNELV